MQWRKLNKTHLPWLYCSSSPFQYTVWLILEITNNACSLLLRMIHQFPFIYWYCALNCCSRMFIVALPIIVIIPLDDVNVSLRLRSTLCFPPLHLSPTSSNTHSTYSAEWCCSVGLALSPLTGLSRERWHRRSTATCQRPPASGWVPGERSPLCLDGFKGYLLWSVSLCIPPEWQPDPPQVCEWER